MNFNKHGALNIAGGIGISILALRTHGKGWVVLDVVMIVWNLYIGIEKFAWGITRNEK